MRLDEKSTSTHFETNRGARMIDLAHKGVTVSTVGIVSKIRQLTNDLPEVSLALSLHAPNQAMREAIVPTAKHYPIEQLIDALDNHMMACLQASRKKQVALKKEKTNGIFSSSHKGNGTMVSEFTVEERQKESSRRRSMIEYVMLEGDTSTDEAAHQLGKLCEGRLLLVNLIPYNATNVQDPLRCPSVEQMNRFRDIVASYGTYCTIRRTMGADIDSACGQLITSMEKKKAATKKNDSEGQRYHHLTDIEDVVKDGTKSPIKKLPVSKSTVPTETERQFRVDDIEHWILPLTVATVISASCFLVSSILYTKQYQKR
jgi:sorting nexin-8